MRNIINFDETSEKRVSYILITKNRALYLDKALSACRELLKPEDELIVIDGGSTDGTAEVVKRHANVVDVFLSEPDINARHAHNKGILLARGKYIKQFGDDDDIIFPEAMDQAAAVMEKHPEIDLLLCGGTKQRGEKTWAVYFPPGIQYGKNTDDVFRYMGPASGTGHVLRRSSVAKIGLISFGDINADAEFVLRSILLGAVVKFCRIRLYHHVIHPHSTGVRNPHVHAWNTAHLVRRYCSFGFFMKYFSLFLLPQMLRESEVGIFKRIGRSLKKYGKRKRYSVTECVWDGGFS
jgi:glycosyltransferase involved in cell wall biosynthesis